MSLLPNKTGLALGALLGSAIGLLFASGSGKDLRSRMKRANTPQKKFEVLFQEYLSAGKNAFDEMEKNSLAKEIVTGGKDILKELKKRAKTEGNEAVQFAQEKAAELIAEAERQIKKGTNEGIKAARSITQNGKKTAAKKVTRVQKKAEEKKSSAKKTVKKTVRRVKKAVK